MMPSCEDLQGSRTLLKHDCLVRQRPDRQRVVRQRDGSALLVFVVRLVATALHRRDGALPGRVQVLRWRTFAQLEADPTPQAEHGRQARTKSSKVCSEPATTATTAAAGGAVPQMAPMHHGRAASVVQTGPGIRTSALSATFSACTTATDGLAARGTERYHGHAVSEQCIHLLRDLQGD